MAIAANFPTVRPSLLLDFSNQTVLDPRVTFARTTTAYYYDNKSAALAEQNLFTYSNTFTNAAWSSNGIATPVQNAIDPSGTTNGAWTFTMQSATNTPHLTTQLQATALSGSTFTGSVYLQVGVGAGSYNFASLNAIGGASNYATVTFNLSTGVVTQSLSSGATLVSSSITQVGSTSWYRCVITFTINTAIAPNLSIQMNTAGTFSPTISGIQSASIAVGTETLLVYGAQLEQRSSPTVYTATTATAVNTYTPTLQSAAINSPRFDYNPTTRESLGLLLEQASTNLFTYSSDYTNAAWTKTNFTNTATIDVSPDGTQNASLMALTSTNSNHTLSQTATLTAASYTLSVYAKAYGSTYPFVQLAASSGIYCNFDLSGGTAGTPSSGTASIQSVGNNWYRCALTFTGTAASYTLSVNYANLITATYQPSVAGNGFNGYLIWGAQVELAPSATSYIATVASAQTRTVDAASMTGTNFTSWYNYSGGTVYVEAASGNPTVTANTSPFILSDASGTVNNCIYPYYNATAVSTLIRLNAIVLQNSTVALPAATVANTFYKTAYYFSTVGTGVSSVGQTATTTATAISAPAINQIAFNSPVALNGRIKKFAYYPLALTNTQIQSLSAN